jgi:hypothetical protein
VSAYWVKITRMFLLGPGQARIRLPGGGSLIWCQLNCHPDRSVAERRDLRFSFPTHGWVPHGLDFLWRLVALIYSMRLSLMKGAHAVLSGTAWQEIGVKSGFGLSGLPQHSTRLFSSLGGSRPVPARRGGICSSASLPTVPLRRRTARPAVRSVLLGLRSEPQNWSSPGKSLTGSYSH